MKIRALVSFAGAFSMFKGEVRECSDKAIISDLLSCNYIEEVTETKKKKVKSDENQ